MKYEIGDLVSWNHKQGKGDYFIITGINIDDSVYYLKYIDNGMETFEPTSTLFEDSTSKVE